MIVIQVILLVLTPPSPDLSHALKQKTKYLGKIFSRSQLQKLNAEMNVV